MSDASPASRAVFPGDRRTTLQDLGGVVIPAGILIARRTSG